MFAHTSMGQELSLLAYKCIDFSLTTYFYQRNTQSGATPLPLMALLLFKDPSVLTLRTLLALPALGVNSDNLYILQKLQDFQPLLDNPCKFCVTSFKPSMALFRLSTTPIVSLLLQVFSKSSGNILEYLSQSE